MFISAWLMQHHKKNNRGKRLFDPPCHIFPSV